MTRYGGFEVADVSTKLFADPKVRLLWSALRDQSAMCEAMTVYLAVVTESWSVGERVDVRAAMPLWLAPSEPVIAALVAAKLLDKTFRIPRRAWSSWYGPAFERREERREAGRRGGLAKAARAQLDGSPKRSSSGAIAELEQSSTRSVPYRTVPTVPSVPRARARGARSHDRQEKTEPMTSFGDAMAAMGFRPPE